MCSHHVWRSFYLKQDDISRVRSCNGSDFVRGLSGGNDCTCANGVCVGTSQEEHGDFVADATDTLTVFGALWHLTLRYVSGDVVAVVVTKRATAL